MNIYKISAKEAVVSHIVDEYIQIEKHLLEDKQLISSEKYAQKTSAMSYLKNLIKTITAETDESIQSRIEEGYERLRKEEESDLLEDEEVDI
jgi:hypothetical protein